MFDSVIYKLNIPHNYIMITSPKFLVNIDSYIGVLTRYVSLKKQLQKISSSCKLN